MKRLLASATLILASLSLISCGGGGGDGGAAITGYTGSTSQASVTSANKQSLAVAATGGAGQAIADSAAANALPLRPAPVSSFMLTFSGQIKEQMRLAHRTANQPVAGVCSPGVADATGNQDGTLVTLVFTDCTVIGGNGEIVNGRVVATTTDPQTVSNLTLQFINFRVDYQGESYTVNATIVCNNVTCSWSSDFTGPDGRTYRTENVEVTSLGSNSFSVSATVYDPDNGFVQISGNVVYTSCTGGVPGAGTLSFIGAGASTGSVNFVSCDAFTVTVDGVATNYLWADFLP